MRVLVHGPLDPAALARAVARPEAGAVVTFLGVSRADRLEDGSVVAELVYEAWTEMALAELGRIREEARARWPAARVAVAHRLGRVPVGEASLAIAVSAPHRAEALDACRWVLDRVKERVPIWKKERSASAERWRANPEAAGEEAP